MTRPRSRALLHRPGTLLGLLNLALDVVLVAGGPLRTSSASFATVRALMPAPAWGVLFLLGGLVCLASCRLGRAGALAVGVGAGVHTFWAAALVDAARLDNRAALTGAVVYAWIAYVHIETGARLAKRVA